MSSLLSLENFFVTVKKCEQDAFRDKFDEAQIRILKEWTIYAIERKYEYPSDIEKRAKEILSDLKIEVLAGDEISSKNKLASYIFMQIFQLDLKNHTNILYAESEEFLTPRTTFNNCKLVSLHVINAILEFARECIGVISQLLGSHEASIVLPLVTYFITMIYFWLFPQSVVINQLNTFFNHNCLVPLISQMPGCMVSFFASHGPTVLEILKKTKLFPTYVFLAQISTFLLNGETQSLFSQICEEKYHFILYGMLSTWIFAGESWAQFLAIEASKSLRYIIPLVQSALTLVVECLDYFSQQITILNKDSAERNWMQLFNAES